MRAASPSFSTAISGDGMSGLPKPEVDHVDACPPCLDLQVVDDREHVRGQVGDAAELHERQRYRCRPSTGPASVRATMAAMKPPARGLHPRGDRDPPWQPQQVRDRPRHRPGLPRPAAVLGHRLPGRLRVPARHPGRGRRPARRPRPPGGPDLPGRAGWRPGRSAIMWMQDEAGPDAKILCVPPQEPRWKGVDDLRRPARAEPPGRDRELLRRVQDARAGQDVDHARLRGPRGGLARRSRRARTSVAARTPERRTDGRAGADVGASSAPDRRTDRRQAAARSAAPMAPACSPSAAISMRGWRRWPGA